MVDSKNADRERYKPDNLGRYKVRDAGAGTRHWLSARIGDPCLARLDAEEGDYIVVQEGVDPKTGEPFLHVTLDTVSDQEADG